MEGLLNGNDSQWLAQEAWRLILGDRFSVAVEQMKPKIYPDGDKWCALYGEDIMHGVTGFGDTPARALADWDNNFWNQKQKTDKHY